MDQLFRKANSLTSVYLIPVLFITTIRMFSLKSIYVTNINTRDVTFIAF